MSETEFDFEDESQFLDVGDGKEYTICLTRNEALYLDDCLTLMIEREASSDHTVLSTLRAVSHIAHLPSPIELVDKVAYAVLCTTDDENPIAETTVSFDNSELYLLREIAQSYVKVGTERVGYNLKRKIYQALFHDTYQKERDIEKMLYDAFPLGLPLTDVPLKDNI